MRQVENVARREDILVILRAIAELHQNLGVAFKARKQLWPTNRNGVVEALTAIAWFLNKLEGFGAYANVLNEFGSALADLDRGSVHAIFVTKAREGGKGKPPDNTDVMCARSRVAIAVSYMLRASGRGRTKEDIANEIAIKHHGLRHIKKSPTSNKPLSASILSWYNDFNQGKVKNQEARDLYRTYQHRLASSARGGKLTPASLNRTAQQQLHLAAEFVPMTKAEALGLGNFIEVKRVPERPKGVRRRRGV
jgi:hypothetical protein